MYLNRFLLAISAAFVISGCATPPTTAELFSPTSIPQLSSDEVVLVIYRQITPPTMYTFTVQVNNTATAELPNQSFVLLKTKAGQATITVTYPAMALIETTILQSNFEGNSIHYLELVGDIGRISLPGPFVQLWGGIAERAPNVALPILTQCCRKVDAKSL